MGDPGVSHATCSMATTTAPTSVACPVRQVILHVYPSGIKAADQERLTRFYGRRGRPVKKARFIPIEQAYAIARKLAAKRLGTVSVL